IKNEHAPELHEDTELYDTLIYLKDVKERNFLKDVNDLIQYYQKKEEGLNEMFDRYELANDEEQLAIKFQSTYATFVKIKDIENHKKSDSLYYPISKEHNLVDYDNISYRDSIQEEIIYLAKIKGNQLADQKNISSTV